MNLREVLLDMTCCTPVKWGLRDCGLWRMSFQSWVNSGILKGREGGEREGEGGEGDTRWE